MSELETKTVSAQQPKWMWRRALTRFALSEEVSLKIVFDNVRNYLICGSVVFISAWWQRGAPGLPNGGYKATYEAESQLVVGIGLEAIAGVLMLLNVWQTFEIVRRLIRPLVSRATAHAENESGHTSILRLMSTLWVLLALLIVIVLVVVMISLLITTMFLGAWFGLGQRSGL